MMSGSGHDLTFSKASSDCNGENRLQMERGKIKFSKMSTAMSLPEFWQTEMIFCIILIIKKPK